MEEAVVEVSHMSYKVGRKYLLSDLSWQVRAGERWVVFGMNGSGKTTLLSIIAGFKQPTSGDIKLFGKSLDEKNILGIRRRISWVSSAFFDQYYTKEAVSDIVLSGKSGTLGLDASITLADRKRAKALLTALRLAERADYTFEMLSKGERQNVLIARALFSKPAVLVLDEPCTGLDIYNREYLFQTLKDLSALKTMTIIYVTHYVEEIPKDFDQCLLLKNGRIFKQGATKEVFQDAIISELLGYPVAIMAHAEGQMTLEVSGVHADIVPYLQ